MILPYRITTGNAGRGHGGAFSFPEKQSNEYGPALTALA